MKDFIFAHKDKLRADFILEYLFVRIPLRSYLEDGFFLQS